MALTPIHHGKKEAEQRIRRALDLAEHNLNTAMEYRAVLQDETRRLMAADHSDKALDLVKTHHWVEAHTTQLKRAYEDAQQHLDNLDNHNHNLLPED